LSLKIDSHDNNPQKPTKVADDLEFYDPCSVILAGRLASKSVDGVITGQKPGSFASPDQLITP